MAFDKNSLARLGSVPFGAGDVKSKYLYATADALATVMAGNYFNSATKTLRKGDVIEVIAALGGTPTTIAVVVTSATGAATVTVAKESDPGGVAGAQAAIADLTAANGAATDVIADVGGAFSQATLNDNFKSLAAKLDATLAALRASGLLAT